MSHPKHVQNLFDNLDKVRELVALHIKIAGVSKGRKVGLETLNKSCIVLLTACWETFVEGLVAEAFDFMINNSESHAVIPAGVLTKASAAIKADNDPRQVWQLAGEGWKTVMTGYKSQIITKELDYFHVPRPENIDALYEKLIGLNSITKHWKWQKMSNAKAIKTLNDFVDLRGEIAHKLKSSRKVLKKDVFYYTSFINCCGVIMHNTTLTHLKKITGKKPWDSYIYKSVH